MFKYQDLSSFNLPKGFRGRSPFVVQLWWIVHAVFFRLSPQFMYGWRRFLLRLFGCKVGKNVLVRSSVRITYPWKVTLGNRVWIGDNAELYSLGSILVGDDTVISQKCYLCTGSHSFDDPKFPIFAKNIVIEDQVWLATDVYIAPGVFISKGVVVGARSSVFSDLSEGELAIGSPARVIKKRYK